MPLLQTWLIVGASRGIGLEFVRQLLARGNYVFATARQPDATPGLQACIDSSSRRCQVLQCDVASESSIQAKSNQCSLSYLDLIQTSTL